MVNYGELISSGSFGTVYHWENDKISFAVKLLKNQKLYNAYLAEMDTLKKLTHQNIVEYKDMPPGFEPAPGDLLIFLEYCAHHSLHDVILSTKYVYQLENVQMWLYDLFCGLYYLKTEHSAVHQDIKPLNLLVSGDFLLKIGDFGTLKILEPAEKYPPIPVGTKNYMAPEYLNVAANPLSAEHFYKADVYGAGVVLWEMITRSEAPAATDDRVLAVGQHVPEALREVLSRCLEKDFKTRAISEEICRNIAEYGKKSVKLGNYGVPCGELPTTSTVIYEESRTPERSAEEKDEAQKLIQNALSEMKKSRARRESAEDQGRISTPPGEMHPADIETMAKIRGHPMFPVLKLFTEKVESATYEMKSSVFKLTDVEALFVELEAQGASPRTEDLELDRLVWDAIYVMRLHLAELARVAKLAEDFRANFSASLKKRVNHETLIGVINESDEEASTSDGESNSRSSLRDHPANTTVAMMNTPHGTLSIPLTLPPINHHLSADSYDLGSPAGKRTRFDFDSVVSHGSSGFMERLGSSRDL
ncbi:unnamed protein product, partial [Mesorhabditis spiculigera]